MEEGRLKKMERKNLKRHIRDHIYEFTLKRYRLILGNEKIYQ